MSLVLTVKNSMEHKQLVQGLPAGESAVPPGMEDRSSGTAEEEASPRRGGGCGPRGARSRRNKLRDISREEIAARKAIISRRVKKVQAILRKSAAEVAQKKAGGKATRWILLIPDGYTTPYLLLQKLFYNNRIPPHEMMRWLDAEVAKGNFLRTDENDENYINNRIDYCAYKNLPPSEYTGPFYKAIEPCDEESETTRTVDVHITKEALLERIRNNERLSSSAFTVPRLRQLYNYRCGRPSAKRVLCLVQRLVEESELVCVKEEGKHRVTHYRLRTGL